MRFIDHVAARAGDPSDHGRRGQVFDPNSGQVQAEVRLGTAADLDRVVAAAQAAQPATLTTEQLIAYLNRGGAWVDLGASGDGTHNVAILWTP